MWKVTIKGLLAHKLRLALTALAIVLGVTFISGTFVLTDTLHNTFSNLFGNIYSKIDFQVRGVAQLGPQAAGRWASAFASSIVRFARCTCLMPRSIRPNTTARAEPPAPSTSASVALSHPLA